MLVAITYAKRYLDRIVSTLDVIEGQPFHIKKDDDDDVDITQPRLTELLYTPTKALRDITNAAIQILDQCFGVLIGLVVIRIQPDTENITLVARIGVVLVMYTYYWVLMYGIHLVH